MAQRTTPAGRIPAHFILIAVLAAALAVAGCSGPKIVLDYPAEVIDFSQGIADTPALYIDQVTDMRPVEQRTGQGHFFGITFPKDESWARPATETYGEALAQDLDQTHLVELVPFRGQADYVLSVDLLSLGCRLERSPTSYLLAGTVGAGIGMALGEDASGRAKRAALLGLVAMAAIPMPASMRGEAEIRMTLRGDDGEIVWQESCLGEYEGRKFLAPTARQDQELVDEYLARAVKRANACLLGQLRQAFAEREQAGSEEGGR